MKRNNRKVVLIGWDAADWNHIAPLLAEGKMPALKRLIDSGVHGNMATMNPPYSPMLWTSVATGKTADEHGVLGFLEIDVEKQRVRPVTSNQRKVKALWNIFHNQGMKSNLIGWWPSFPADRINGHIVSDLFPKSNDSSKKEWSMPVGTVYPESLAEEIHDLRVHPGEITEAHVLPFVPNAHKIDQEKDKAIIRLQKLISQGASIHAASTYLMRSKEWEFTGIYHNMIDHFCHAFMKFYPPKLAPIPQEYYDLYKDVVSGAYRFQDMMLERTLELIDEDTLVIIMSDHGFESGPGRSIKKPKNFQAAPALDHREFGIFVASGPGIKKGEKVFGLSLLDVAPTILHYMGLPVGKDMSGNVIVDAFEDPGKIEFIESWEQVEGDFGMRKGADTMEDLSNQEAMEQLIELGYVDRPNANIEKTLLLTKCELRYNLARVYMSKKDYKQAQEILQDLVQEDVNTVPYYMDLINVHLLREDYKEAARCLEELRKVDKTYLVKTKLLEAKILIGEGKIKRAEHLLREVNILKDKTGVVRYELGKLLMRLGRYDKALEEFKKAIELKPDNAKYHASLANCYLRLDDPEEAVDHALISVELMRYFPDAHYIMGEALEKLGDKENAVKAYEMAKKLSPKMKRPSLAIQNMVDREALDGIDLSLELDEVLGEVTVVSGLPRSGTSMMMQMLAAGGLEVMTDSVRQADTSNPKGYYEYQKVKSLHKDNSWVKDADGKTLKVIAQLLKFLPIGFKYKVIFMRRDVDEVIKSQQIMLGRADKNPAFGLKETFLSQLKDVDVWQKKEPGVDLIYVNYAEVIQDPYSTVDRIISFLDADLDREKMLSSVDKSLYRNRKKK